MSELLRRIQTLALAEDIRVSDHGYTELVEDDILLSDAIDGLMTAIAIEEDITRSRGPAVLTLQHDKSGRPIHVVWALPAGERRPAVLVTAYRPDPRRWSEDFRIRRRG